MNATEKNHAIENAKGWYQSIVEMLEELDNAKGMDAEESAENEIQESVLSIEVQSDWHTPGENEDKPTEYLILLTIGGPALRIIGNLDDYQQPNTAKLQWQDWGTPWNTIWTTDDVDIEEDTLLKFANHFYFGS